MSKELKILLSGLIIFSGAISFNAYGQKKGGDDNINLIYSGGSFDEVAVEKKRSFDSKEDRNAYYRLVYNMKVVYPYYKEAVALHYAMQGELSTIDKKRKQKKVIKDKEKYIKENFTDPLKNLTVSQGKLLVTMLELKTGLSCFELIKEYKSGLSATYWNGMGKFFGYNLKNRKPMPTDKYIPNLMKKMEAENPIPIYYTTTSK